MISKYIIVSIYLVSTIDTNQKIEAVITWETYLIDSLKTKILVSINIIRSKQIDIITLKKQAVIDLCQNTIILIKVHLQSCSTWHIIYTKSNLIILLHTEQPISIHHIRHLPDQNFLFKLKDLSLTLYTYIIDLSFFIIITENETAQSISIRYN